MFTFRFSLLKMTITFTTEKICFYERERKKNADASGTVFSQK